MTEGRVLQMAAPTREALRPLPVDVLKAAVIAARSGAFDTMTRAHLTEADADCDPTPLSESGAPLVAVLAGHAGAGASTVALALAEALSGRWRVQLVEYSDSRRSGLGAASSTEFGVDDAGWRRGRRGQLELARYGRDVDRWLPPLPLPPSHGTPPGDRLVVLDLGWAASSSLRGSEWLPTVLGSAELVVVTRLTVPGVRQTEHFLATLRVSAVLATVGSGRWPGEVTASCGPAIRAAREAGRAVMVPVDRRLEISGLTADPLPKPVSAAGKSLAAHLCPEQPVLPGMSVTPEEGF